MAFLLKLLELIKISMKNQITYVTETWTSIVVSIVEIIAYYYLWQAVFGENYYMNNMSKLQITTYIILARVLFMQMGWGANTIISEMIQTGEISMHLLRPIDFELSMYMSRLGNFAISVVLQSIPTFIISIMLFGITVPISTTHLLLFIISIFFQLP